MKLSHIKELFASELSTEKLRKQLANEMNEYIKNSQKKGSSQPVYLEEDIEISIGKPEAIFLLNAYIKSEFSISEINYIVDTLILSEKVKFESESFSEEFETLTDSEVHGHLTLDRALELIDIFRK